MALSPPESGSLIQEGWLSNTGQVALESQDYSPHPNHIGDLPPILSANGMAFSAFFTNRFYPEDIVGRTIIIHAMPDDFNSQPSGNAGAMVACGEIMENDEAKVFPFQ